MKIWRAAALGLGLLALLAVVFAFVHRVPFPYDLEWMEGGVLCQALRIARHQPIYAAPSVDFIPFLYTPLYPALLAALSPIVSIGYGSARILSLLGFCGALVLGYVYARRAGQARATAFVALALPAAAFVPTGAFVDLARPDSLYLGLVTTGLFVGWWQRRSHLGVAVAALLLCAAFFTKQTASPFMAALGIAILFASPQKLPTYVATLAVIGLPILWLLNRSTGGWFWTYVFRLHQLHDFYPVRAFIGSPLRLLLLLGPATLLVPWALKRRRSPDLVFATLVGITGIAAACIGFGTQWAFTNAFIPGIFFPAVAIGTAAGRLTGKSDQQPTPRHRPAVVFVLLALSVISAAGGLLPLVGRRLPSSFGITATEPTGYSLTPYLPRLGDRQAGDALIHRLAREDGDVLIPFHPFYAHLANKPTYLHRMGVLDVGRAGLGTPSGLAEAIRSQHFALVVMDDKIDGNWQMWPGLLERYHIVETIAGPNVPSGAATHPRYILEPTQAASAPPAAATTVPVIEPREP